MCNNIHSRMRLWRFLVLWKSWAPVFSLSTTRLHACYFFWQGTLQRSFTSHRNWSSQFFSAYGETPTLNWPMKHYSITVFSAVQCFSNVIYHFKSSRQDKVLSVKLEFTCTIMTCMVNSVECTVHFHSTNFMSYSPLGCL